MALGLDPPRIAVTAHYSLVYGGGISIIFVDGQSDGGSNISPPARPSLLVPECPSARDDEWMSFALRISAPRPSPDLAKNSYIPGS